MDGLEYGDSGAWPVAADGLGASLAKRVAASPSSPSENWRASHQVGGKPGAVNFPETGSSPQVVHDALVTVRSSGRWWVRFDTVRAGSLVLRTDDAGPTVSWSHQLRVTAGRRFEHYTFDGEWNVITGTTPIQPGRWYHVAATAESGGVSRLYVNGLPEGGSEPVGTLWAGGNRWMLGTPSQGFPNAFQGSLDDFAIWDHALKPVGIEALVRESAPTAGGGLGAWLRTDLEPAVRGNQSSVWVRQEFEAPASRGYDELMLRMRYDDGFVAGLNGVEVARGNAPESVTWRSPFPSR